MKQRKPIRKHPDAIWWVMSRLMQVAATLLLLVCLWNVVGLAKFYATSTKAIATAHQYGALNARENGEANSQKVVNYSFTHNGRTYMAVNEVSESAYKKKPKEFTVRYQADNPDGEKFISIKSPAEEVITASGIVFSLVIIKLASTYRKVSKLHKQYQLKACVCGRVKDHIIFDNHDSFMRIGMHLLVLSLFAVVFALGIFEDKAVLIISALIFFIRIVPIQLAVKQMLGRHTPWCAVRFAAIKQFDDLEE